jgi:phosphoribosylanthranilate isomerase
VPQSPRNISITLAKKLMEATPIFIDTVAVIVPKDLDHLMKIYREIKPANLQIHGLEHLHKQIREKITNIRLIGTLQAKQDLNFQEIPKITESFDAILLDSYVDGKKGGSGVPHNWAISQKVKEMISPTPLILAGGLSPQNVKDAINTVKPYAVDVSSGVEASPGKKDRDKVFDFIKKAKEVEL